MFIGNMCEQDEVGEIKVNSLLLNKNGSKMSEEEHQIRQLYEGEAKLRDRLSARIARAQEKVNNAQLL